LHDPGAITHVKEQQIAQVAPAGDPAHDHGVPAYIGHAQFAAVMCALQVAEKI
jgi:hypothetical protein